MIPSIVGLTSYLARRRRKRAERDRMAAALHSELQRVMPGEILRLWLERLDMKEIKGIVHFTAMRKGDEVHVGVRVVIPLRTEAAT
jgi:hypothetical protein